MCTCNQQNSNPCNTCQPTICQPPVDCSCPVRITTDCATYNGDDLPCSGIVSGLTLTETIIALDAYICEAISDIDTTINLINVGTGRQIYAGIDALGRRKIRSIITTGSLLTSTQNENDITFTIDEVELVNIIKNNEKTYSVSNVGTGAQVYKNSTIVGDNIQFNQRTLTSLDGSVDIVQSTDTIDFSVAVYDGSETEITAGSNVSVTGNGTSATPYIINATDTDTIVELQDGITTIVSGDGVTTPYSVETVNLQKVVNTFPYTILNSDDKHTIFIDNGASDVIINIPNSIVDNFCVSFIQEGTGDVSFQVSGSATLLTAIGNKIKGQYYWALLEKKQSLNTFYLIGSLKI